MPRDPRPYITVDVAMPHHRKIEGLSDAAFRLLVTAWCWCAEQKTNGELDTSSWTRRGSRRARQELISAGLAHEGPDGKVLMHDYLEHQNSAQQIRDLQEKRRSAGAKGGRAKALASATAHALASATASAVADAKQNAGKSVPEVKVKRARDTSSSLGAQQRATRGTRLPEDWRPSEADAEWLREAGISELLARAELPKFANYWLAKSGQGATKLDWSRTWRNWLLTAQERTPGNARTSRAGERW